MCIPFVAAGAAVLGTQLSAFAAGAINVGLTASLVAGAAGSALSVAGQVQAGKAAKEQGQYEAKMARYEAAVAKNAGEVEMVRLGIEQRREWGRFMLQNAASNRDLSFGNAARQAIEVRRFQTFDSEIIARNVDARVTSLNLSSSNAIARGKNQQRGYTFGAASAGIGLVTNLASDAFSYANIGNAAWANSRRLSPSW